MYISPKNIRKRKTKVNYEKEFYHKLINEEKMKGKRDKGSRRQGMLWI